MRSSRGSSSSSSTPSLSAAPVSARSHATPTTGLAPSHAFQMPPYTSHTNRHSPSKKQSSTRPYAQQQYQHDYHQQQSDGNHPSQSYSDSDHNLLAMLTSTVACLKEKRMDVEALGCLEQILWLQRRMFGAESATVHRAVHEVVLSYNSIAMQFLALGQFDQCLSMLRKAEAITAPPGNFPNVQSLQILTFNNIGCCYRKLGKLKSALKYLKEAAQIGAGCARVKNLSITHLNLCAIQSQLGRHDLALEHAQAAIFHTQEELVDLDSAVGSPRGGGNHEGPIGRAQGDVLDAKTREEKIVSLAVAYHNLAVELEFNGRGEASLQWYKKALQLVSKFRESNRALCESFEKIFLDAKNKYHASGGAGAGAGATTTAPHTKPTVGGVAARPKSAHVAAARTQRDMSYSATVASQCYKPTKPSTAGLQYSQSGASSPPTARPTGSRRQQQQAHTQQQQQHQQWRPSSANPSRSNSTSRRRPLSASSSSRQSSRQPSERIDHCDAAATTDTLETRWTQIEKELFGPKAPPQMAESSARSRPARPQSARSGSHSHVAATSRNSSSNSSSSTHERASVKPYLRQTDLLEEDDACGIIQDDDGDEDGDAGDGMVDVETQFLEARVRHDDREACAKHRAGLPRSSSHHQVDTRAKQAPRSAREVFSHPEQQRKPTSARHRQVIHDTYRSRSRSTEKRRDEQDQHEAHEDDAGNTSGYAGGVEDDSSELSESSSTVDLPQHRVSHLEYLRRMKKLTESIQSDLQGTAPPPAASRGTTTTTTTRRTASAPKTSKESAVDRQPLGGRSNQQPLTLGSHESSVTRAAPVPRTPPTPRVEVDVDVDTAAALPTTSRSGSSSKLRERLELVRRESVKSTSLNEEDANEDQGSAALARVTTTSSAAVVIEEDVFVFSNVKVVKKAEHELIQAASARKIQAVLRGNAAHCRVAKLREERQQDAAARAIQQQSRHFLEAARERELHAREQAKETQRLDDAATVIQSTFRRKFRISSEVNDESTEVSQMTRDEEEEEGEEEEKQSGGDAVENETAYTPLPSARSSSSTTPQAITGDMSSSSSRQSTSRSSSSLSDASSDDSMTTTMTTTTTATSSSRSSSVSLAALLTARSESNSSRSTTPRALPSARETADDVRAEAAVRIQNAFRVYRAFHEVATKRMARRLSRSYVERKHLSLVLVQAESKEQSFLESLSAIKIQALVRGRQARVLFEATRVGRHAAASAIQLTFRRHRQQQTAASARGVYSVAARCIQRVFRAYASRQVHCQQCAMHDETVGVHHLAAQTIQHLWRQWRSARERSVEAWEAATCIQALGRGHLARKSYQSLKESTSKASAFSIGDGDETVRGSSWHEQIHGDKPDAAAYEEVFEEEEDEDARASGGGNLSFLPARIRELYVRFEATGSTPVVANRTSMATKEMLAMGYGVDAILEEFQSECSDAESACLLLDALQALVVNGGDAGSPRTLPQLLAVTRVVDKRMDECGWWGDPVVEKRVAALVYLFQELLVK